MRFQDFNICPNILYVNANSDGIAIALLHLSAGALKIGTTCIFQLCNLEIIHCCYTVHTVAAGKLFVSLTSQISLRILLSTPIFELLWNLSTLASYFARHNRSLHYWLHIRPNCTFLYLLTIKVYIISVLCLIVVDGYVLRWDLLFDNYANKYWVFHMIFAGKSGSPFLMVLFRDKSPDVNIEF